MHKGEEFNQRLTGKILNQRWKVGAKHPLYRRDGKFFNNLNKFPGALFDPKGYVLFKTEAEYQNCEYLKIIKKTNVKRGISKIPSYVLGIG